MVTSLKPAAKTAASQATMMLLPTPWRAQPGCTKKARIRAGSVLGSISGSSPTLPQSPPQSDMRLLQPPQPMMHPLVLDDKIGPSRISWRSTANTPPIAASIWASE
jgi:hypothetical protein